MTQLKKIATVVLFLILLGIIVFLSWARFTYRSSEEVNKYLKSHYKVFVTNKEQWIAFKPKHMSDKIGVIFYPGAKVEPESYAPLASQLARKGYLVVITKMPLNLAMFDSNRADLVMKEFRYIDSWYIGGHSLGGAMASKYAMDQNKKIEGLYLLGAYPAYDMRSSPLDVLSIYGTKDGLATKEEVLESRELLPESTEMVKIEGGNHSQFGSYGFQRKDGVATISRNEQQRLVVKAIDAFIEHHQK